jgi:hypothetical protein
LPALGPFALGGAQNTAGVGLRIVLRFAPFDVGDGNLVEKFANGLGRHNFHLFRRFDGDAELMFVHAIAHTLEQGFPKSNLAVPHRAVGRVKGRSVKERVIDRVLHHV